MNKLICLAAALSVSATAANAAVLNATSGIYEGAGKASGGATFDFSWDASNAPFAGYIDFEADAAFDIYLTDYSSDAIGVSAAEVSGTIVERRASLGGDVLENLSNDVPGCGNFLFSVISFDSCDFVTYSGYTGDNSAIATQPGEILLGGLEAGFYRFAFAESGSPATGSVQFEVRDVGVVPLPAALPMLLFALGGLSIVGRRRS